MKKIFLSLSLILLLALLGCAKQVPEHNDLSAANSTITSQADSFTDQEDNNTIIISSDKYYEYINNVCKEVTETESFYYWKESYFRNPYWVLRFKTDDLGGKSFTDTVTLMAQEIYDKLIDYEYENPPIYSACFDTLNLTFYAKTNNEESNQQVVQICLNRLDKSKTFEENVKIFRNSVSENYVE